MSYEMHRGRPDAARRILLRAVHTCPGAKALWLDGLHFLAEQVMLNPTTFNVTAYQPAAHSTPLHHSHLFTDSDRQSCDVLLQMPGTERKDLLQLMTAKGLQVRTDTYEILLKTAGNAP